MNAHFTSFTPEAMRALGQNLADGFHRRAEFLSNARNRTHAMLATFRKDHRERASREADARRLFMSELKSGVHSLLGRCELSRKEMAEDIQEMARECHAASDSFRNRPRPHHAPPRRDFSGRPPKHTPSGPSTKPFRPAAESHEASKPSTSSQSFRPAESQDASKPRPGPEDKPGDSKKHQG